MNCRHGFTLIDALASLVLVTVFAGLAVGPATQPADDALKRRLQSMTQQRGIHQAFVVYAQANNTWYPGIDPQGKVLDVSNEAVIYVLLDGNYFTGEYALSPMEEKVTPWKPDDEKVTVDNLSYAILDVADMDRRDGRRAEWRDTLNTRAAVLSDRNTGPAGEHSSVYTAQDGNEGWKGGVVWNDNHASFEDSHVLSDTVYGVGNANQHDDLFAAVGLSDALMTFHKDGNGDEVIVPKR